MTFIVLNLKFQPLSKTCFLKSCTFITLILCSSSRKVDKNTSKHTTAPYLNHLRRTLTASCIEPRCGGLTRSPKEHLDIFIFLLSTGSSRLCSSCISFPGDTFYRGSKKMWQNKTFASLAGLVRRWLRYRAAKVPKSPKVQICRRAISSVLWPFTDWTREQVVEAAQLVVALFLNWDILL